MDNNSDNNPKYNNLDEEDIIRPGKYIIIRKTFDVNSCKLIKLNNEKYFYFFKQKIVADSIIGHKFGSTFELTQDKTLKLVNISDYVCNNLNLNDGSNTQKDNRFIRDDNTSQKLSRNDIEKIKKENSGEVVIRSLIENSVTFEEKNAFSQAKYLHKKQQKYVYLYTILRPTTKFLMEMYYAQGPGKNNYLRIDSLAQMLTLGNIMAGGKYLLVDSNLGILSAAILEKTLGNCKIIQIDMSNNCNVTQRQAVYALNYPASIVEKCLSCISISHAASLLNKDNCSKEFKQRKNKKLQLEEDRAKAILKEKNLDALLIMSKSYDLCCLAEILVFFLSISRPFVIFCPSIEPLKECFVKLKGKCVFMRLSETWLRKYQVLNDRTRPDMMMNACSGFILSGIKVET